jgi:hypothetical protein
MVPVGASNGFIVGSSYIPRDPKELLNRVVDYLKTPGFSHEARKNFMSTVPELSNPGFAIELYSALPAESWPLAFLYCNLFGATLEGQFAEIWIERTAQALLHMKNNPCLIPEDEQSGWAMRELYHAACRTNTIHQIIKRFVAICPPDQFIAIMNDFKKYCFGDNPEGFNKLIAAAIQEVDNKPQFIAEVVILGHQRGLSPCWPFLNEPFLKTDEEKVRALKFLTASDDDPLLCIFCYNSDYALPLIISLHITDPTLCLSLYKDTVERLLQKEIASQTKQALTDVISATFIAAGADKSRMLGFYDELIEASKKSTL